MAYIYDIADTWNASGTTFTAIKMNVTDTASAAGSLLMDLQVGGASRFVVSKAGRVTLGSSTNLGELQFTEGIGVKVRLGSGSGQDTFAILANNGIAFKSSGVLFWSGAEDSFGATDLQLRRDAANTLGQRNGVNAQAFNLYNTYTDASNYERGFMRFVSNVLEIGTEKLGTGTARGLAFHTNGTTRMTIAADASSFAFAGASISNLRITGSTFSEVGALSSGVNSFIGAGSGTASMGSQSNHPLEIRANNVARLKLDTSGSVEIANGRTVATLSAVPVVGMMARVTDATTPAVGSTVVGGGAANALCWYNGTNWTVIGV